MPLNDTRLRGLKPRPKVYRVADMDGLCIEVRPTGARCWRFRYRFAGRANMLDLGAYPAVSLHDARRERDRLRAMVRQGVDPSAARRNEQAQLQAEDDRFEAVALEWLGKQGAWSDATRDKATALLETWAYPWLGKRRLREITVTDMLVLIQRPEAQGKIETAQRLKQRCGQIFRYGFRTGRCDSDPTATLKDVLKTVKVRHHASLTDRKRVGGLLRAIDTYPGTFVVMCAMKLSALTLVRPGELRAWEWGEIIEDGALWRLPAEKMKMRVPHLVPLARQTREVLDELRPMTGSGPYVLPGARGGGRSLSENAVRVALRSLGFTNDEMTAHGFRSMASTLLNEDGWNGYWIERQLAHVETNKVRGSYNYAEYLPGRRDMMQAWADLLDKLRRGGQVVPIRAIG